MNDYGRIGEGIGALLIAAAILLCVFVPLGAWKLIEIAIWCWSHLSVTVQ